MKKIFFLLLSLVLFTSHLQANKDIAFSINDFKAPKKSVAKLYSVITENQKISHRDFLQMLINNHLIATYYRHSIAEEIRLTTDYAELKFMINRLLGKQHWHQNKEQITLNLQKHWLSIKSMIKPHLTARPSLTPWFEQPHFLNPAKKMIIATYHFTEGSQKSIHLYDFIHYLSIQQRQDLLATNLPATTVNLEAYIQQHYMQHLARHKLGLKPQEFTALMQLIQDRTVSALYYKKIGVYNGMHSQNKKLSQLSKTISQKAIKAYYQNHKERFRQVDSVSAKQLIFSSQKKADRAYLALRKGMSFDNVGKKYQALKIETLGKISNQPGLSFSQKIALMQKINEVSRPYRTQQGWEIFLLDQRTEKYIPIDSSIQHEISRILALEKLNQQLNNTLQRLRKKANIILFI